MNGRPAASSEQASRRLRRQRRTGTAPEMALRRALHAQGLRYRVDAPLPLEGVRRRADLLFTRARVAVFVDGCFWHGCPLHATSPRSNSAWWSDKLAANVRRDQDTDHRLQAVGWMSVRVWEHEDAEPSAARVREVVLGRREET